MKIFSQFFWHPQQALFRIFAALFVLGSIGMFASDRLSQSDVSSENGNAVITMFSREKCSHCQAEKEFFEEWKQQIVEQKLSVARFSSPEARAQAEQEYKEFAQSQFQILDIAKSDDASAQFHELTDHFGLSKSTPLTIVGDRVFVGFDTAENMGRNLQSYYASDPSPPSFSEVWGNMDSLTVFGSEASVCTEESEECAIEPTIVSVPFFGELDVSSFQNLHALSFTLGFIDGFNPCAMWVLVIFLLALIQIGDKVKMFITAGIFLFAEAVMYTLILTLWFSTWNFVGLDAWMTPIVGFVALGSGIFFLHEGIFSDGTCKVADFQKKKKISQRIQEIAHSPLSVATLLGILILAFSVNVIEFACSIGIPQTFTQILHISDLMLIEKIWHIILYIFAYMIDDLIVFGIALYSIEKIGVTQKYARTSNFIGGILMMLLGLLLVFAPQFLTFG